MGPPPAKRKRHGAGSEAWRADPGWVYVRPEDAHLADEALWCYAFPSDRQPMIAEAGGKGRGKGKGKGEGGAGTSAGTSGNGLTQLRLVALLDAQGVVRARQRIDAQFGFVAPS